MSAAADEEVPEEVEEGEGAAEEGGHEEEGEEESGGAEHHAQHRPQHGHFCQHDEQAIRRSIENLYVRLHCAKRRRDHGEARSIEIEIVMLRAAEDDIKRERRREATKYLKPMAGYYSARSGQPIRRNVLTSTLKHLGWYRGRRH